MRLVRTTKVMSWDFGIYIVNWGYPVANELEIGIDLGKWSFGIELYG